MKNQEQKRIGYIVLWILFWVIVVRSAVAGSPASSLGFMDFIGVFVGSWYIWNVLPLANSKKTASSNQVEESRPNSESSSAITTTPKAKTTASTTHSQRVAQMEDWMDQVEESRPNSESASAITTTPKANTTARTGVKQDSQHRGTVSCEECDGKISKRLSACPHCGCPVRKKVQCVDCDATFNADLKACPDCGGPV